MRKGKQQKEQEREGKLRRDEHGSFVVEEEDNLVRDNVRSVEEIARQESLINMRTEKIKLGREEEEVEELIRDQLSNSCMASSGAADLG